MSTDSLKRVIEDNVIPMDVADKYLRLYVADIDWAKNISDLWVNANKKNLSIEEKKDFMKRSIACTILTPLVNKSAIPDPPQNLLFWVSGWRTFYENDWFDLFKSVVKQDIEISEKRNSFIMLGVIDPIDISPLTRQAFNWLYDAAENAGCMIEDNKENLVNKFSNLVRAYGGAIICNMFVNHKMNIDKILNWRSGYFFEKEIYKVYSVEQIVKIKNSELNKTNSQYVKKIGA
jgi:hypothetical protein